MRVPELEELFLRHACEKMRTSTSEAIINLSVYLTM